MTVLLGGVPRRPLIGPAAILGSLGLFAYLVVDGASAVKFGPALIGCVLIAVAHRRVFAWETLLSLIILVMLLMPISYTLPASLPFQLEPYRLVVGFVAIGWLISLLVDPRVRLRRTGLDGPIVAFVVAILASLIVNADRVNSVSHFAAKKTMFFAAFLIVVYLIASVVRNYETVERLLKVLVLGSAVVAAGAIFEARTGTNIFNQLDRVFPFLRESLYTGASASTDNRGAGSRAFASAQHPIALGAALVMMIPLAIGLAKSTGQKRWLWLTACLLLPGAIGSVSRTAVTMLLAVFLVFLMLRPAQTRRLWPAIFPLFLAIHFAVPGTLGTLANSFFPKQGLLAQQQDTAVGSGRLATLGPALRNELAPQPLVGEGFGTRVVTDEDPTVPRNAPITDNQWLSTLLETGLVGAVALLWLFVRMIRRAGRIAKRDFSPRGWLLAGITASVTAYGVGMLTYDAFSFIQVTFLFFIVLGLGSALLGLHPTREEETAQTRAAFGPAV